MILIEIIAILIFGYLVGRVFEQFKLPKLLGYLLFGMASQFIPFFEGDLLAYKKLITTTALSIVLFKAGLGIDSVTIKVIGDKALKLGIIPNLIEALFVGIMAVLFMGLSWIEAGILAFIISPVSPAVVIPSMLKLKERGLNRSGIPVMNLASASIDDIVSVLMFSFFLVLYFQSASGIDIMTILMPFIYIGIMVVGYLLHDKELPKLKTTVNQSWNVAQIFLFFVIGAIVNISTMTHLGVITIVIVIVGLIGRMIGVFLSLRNTLFSKEEKLFCMIANTPKATVQASLGALPLLYGVSSGNEILAMSTFAILLTAPIGLLLIEKFAYKLLS